MKKKFILLSLMLAAVFTASATITKTIGDPSKVAGTYDYTSLHAASLDLYTTPLTDDCIWLICTDLDETINAGITNNTEHSLIIRPNADEERTITYSTTADNVGPSGNIILGGIPESTQATNIKWVARPTNNVTIDGFAEGGSLHRMKIIGSDAGGRTIALYGAVTNAVIKNCVIDAPRVRTNSTATYAMEIRVEQLAGGTPSAANKTDNTPTGTLIENCQLSVLQSKNAQTIVFNGANSKTAAGKPQNTTIRNCEIISNLRGVFFNGANDVNVEGCTFRLPSASPGYLAHGIMGNAQTGVINVKGCKFLELKTNNVDAGDYGIQGITASGGGTWNIENNIFTGLDALADVTGIAIKLCGVRCGSPCVVRHNTFVMPTLTNVPATALTSAYPISLLYVAGTTYTVENNIFVSHETIAHNSLIRGALNDNCKHNVFYHDGGNAAIVAGAVNVMDEAALATADPTSKWKAVTFDSDMMLSGASITDNDLAVAQVAGITTDILGNTRNNPTYAGAEDPDQLTGFTHHLYEIGDNEGWDPVNSPEMTMVEPNVFEGTFDFTANTSYFAFTTVQSNDWDVIHAHRYGAAGTLVTDGSEQELVYNGDNSLTIAPGTYKFRVDLNQNPAKVYVEGYLYEIGNNIDWNLENHVAMTKVAANVYEKELTLTKDTTYLAFTRCASTTDWDAVNAARYATGIFQERLDDGSDETLVKGDGDATVTLFPGVYTIRVNFNTNKITVSQSVAKVSFDSEIGYATYYNSKKGYTMPTNVTGYAFNYPGAGLTQAFEAGEDVPAGVALVLAGPAGTFDLVLKTGVPAVDLANQLRGTDTDALTTAPGEGSYLFYGLSLAAPEPGLEPDPQSVGFYWMAENGAAFTNHAHKAYLALLENFLTPAPERILFNNNGATDIKNVEGQDEVVKFIQDGKLFIQKNGVTYDALGRVVR